MTKILDIQQSISAANGNASLAKELFTMLIDDLDLRLQQIETSFQANDLKSLEEHTHKLYGATAYCIVPKLRNSAAKLEQAVRSEPLTELHDLVDNLVQDIKHLIHVGPEYLEQEWVEESLLD